MLRTPPLAVLAEAGPEQRIVRAAQREEPPVIERQEAHLGTRARDSLSSAFSPMAAKIVEDDDVARPQARRKRSFDIGGKARPMIGPSKTAGEAMLSQRNAIKMTVNVFQWPKRTRAKR